MKQTTTTKKTLSLFYHRIILQGKENCISHILHQNKEFTLKKSEIFINELFTNAYSLHNNYQFYNFRN